MITWFYFITFATTVLLMGISIFKNKRIDTSYMLFCIMIFFNAMGRWLVAASETLEQAIWANKMLYFGGCYTPLLMIIVLARISDIRIPAVLKMMLALYSTLVFGLVMTIGYSSIYYKSIRLEEGIGYHYLVKEYGPAHNLYTIMMILYVILLLFLLVRAFHKRKTVAFGTVFSIGILGLVVIFTYLMTRLINSSIEWLSIGYMIAVVIISKLFDQINRYDMSTNIAVAVASTNENGYIVFDSKKRYVNSNSLIKQLYPEIAEWQVEAVPPQSGSFFSDEVICWFLDNGSTKEHKMIQAGENYYEITVRDITSGMRNRKVGYLMEATDRTAEQNYTIKVEETAHIANEANKAKSDFLAMMSHEIRTPLNAVIGMNEMILQESSEESVLTYADKACVAGRTLLSVINNILDISKIEAGRMEITEDEYNLSALVCDCYNLTSYRAEKKGLVMTCSSDEKLPARLYGDMFHIRQIVVNFITNAIKYTDKGSIEISFTGMETETGFALCISVKDTGIGLTPESLDKLFTSFQRFDMKRNANVEGTGLGLAICKQLAELMNGTIKVDSEYGKGSVFSVIIPQKITDNTPAGNLSQMNLQHRQKEYTGNITFQNARVLVVDDFDMNLFVFESFVKNTGLVVETAESGNECLRLVKEKAYDIIFLDHMMPEMDGIETFHNMKKIIDYPNSSTPVIMLTANAISGIKDKYVAEGFSGYLSKPVERKLLYEILLKYLPKEKTVFTDNDNTDTDKEKNITEETVTKAALNNRFESIKAAFPDINIEAGLAYCSDSEDFYAELLKDLADPGKLNDLQTAYDTKNWKLYGVKVHALKGAAKTLGLENLRAISEKLQKAAETADTDYIESNHDKAAALLNKLAECTGNL